MQGSETIHFSVPGITALAFIKNCCIDKVTWFAWTFIQVLHSDLPHLHCVLTKASIQVVAGFLLLVKHHDTQFQNDAK